jgi:hypothetical protein
MLVEGAYDAADEAAAAIRHYGRAPLEGCGVSNTYVTPKF